MDYSHRAEIIEIENVSDCVTCTQRYKDEWDMLTKMRCDLLEGLRCPECGREIDIWIEHEPAFDD
jgi:hypothetical protein